MVEQMGVEPTTYTMRTYRSSQLSYCPTMKVSYTIHPFLKKASGTLSFFHRYPTKSDLLFEKVNAQGGNPAEDVSFVPEDVLVRNHADYGAEGLPSGIYPVSSTSFCPSGESMKFTIFCVFLERGRAETMYTVATSG